MIKNRIIAHYAKENIAQEMSCALLYLIFIACSLSGPVLMEYFIDNVIPLHEIKPIVYFAIVFLCIYILMAIIALLIKRTIITIENRIITDIRSQMYENLVFQPLHFYQEHSLGAAMERIVGDTEVIRSLWGFLFPNAFSSILTFIATFIIMLSKSVLIAALSIVSIVIYLMVFRYYNEKLRSLYLKTRKDIDNVNNGITDAWSGAKELKIFRFESSIVNRFLALLGVLKNDSTQMGMKNEFSKQFMSLATTLGSLITLVIGGIFVIKGELTLGTMLALQAYVLKLYSPAEDIADMAVDYKKYTVNLERISQILFLEKEDLSDNIAARTIKPMIKFDHVSFSYGAKKVLDDISFKTANHGVVALVGASGAGKSTIVNLALGFLVADSGSVMIEQGQSGTLPLSEIRRNITLVSQDTYLFNASIYENIRIGNPSATEAEILTIIRRLEIDKIVEVHEKGIHATISEFGKNLSGGQIQRISIARALLKKAPIIIFDEATSNIDSQSEQIIHGIIEELMPESLIIMISHRLSSLKIAENILVLENGRIVEQGTIEELESNNGVFCDLFRDQLT